MVTWTRADVVILTAIELEYAAVKLVEAGAAPGSRWVEDKHDGLPVALREFVGSGGRRLRIVVNRAPDMGKGSAVTTLLPLVNALRPSCIAMCGVCAGRPGKTALGDVVVGERLYDYDAGKWKEVGFEADVRTYSLPAPWKIAAEQFQPKARFGGQDWWQRRPVPYEWQENWVLIKLHAGVEDLEALPESKDRCPQWSTVIKNLWAAGDVKRNTRSLTAKGRKRAAGVAIQYPQLPDLSPGGDFMPFQLHVQPIGSGSAVREDIGVWGFITPHMRKTLALEMEASALADIVRARAHHDPIEAVVMKGVMDFANDGRDDHFKHYAARASAECLVAFLRDQLAGGAAVGDGETSDGRSLPGGGIDARIARTKQQVAGPPGGPHVMATTSAASRHIILFLAANPCNTNRLALDEECAAIERELRMTPARDDFDFRSKWAVSVDEMMRHLNELQPAILHFSGHGSSSGGGQAHDGQHRDLEAARGSGIYLHDERRSQHVSERALAQMIASAAPSVRVVVLNACFSATVAESLRHVVDCVVGMDGAIGDDAARSFAVAFYRALGNRRSVGNAVAQAVATLSAKQLPDEHLPVYRTRDDVSADQSFLPSPAPWPGASQRPSPPERSGHGGGIAASSPTAAVAAYAAAARPTPTPVGVASAEVVERLARMKREVTATLKAHPRLSDQLAARIECPGCPREVLPDRLVDLRGSVVAEHVLAVSDSQPPTAEGDANRVALQSVLFTVLPYVSDWRAEVALCCARGEGQAGVVELRYRSDTIAEAVMAGWVGRRCCFEHKSGAEPYGVGAVQLPATSQTALFTSEQHLLEGVVNQLTSQLGVGGLNLQEQRTRVQRALRNRSRRVGAERMRYYFLFRDAASPEDPGALWRLARTTLHAEAGLPSLVLVRMQGQLDDDEADLEEYVAAMLKPRTPPRS